MIKVKVESTHVECNKGVSNAGKPYQIFKQTVWAMFMDATGVYEPYPRKAKLTVQSEADAYPVGNYLLSPSCFGLNKWDEFEIRSPKLIPATASIQKAA